MPLFEDFYNTISMKGGDKMTIKEKLQSCVDNGIPISFVARKMQVDPSTLSKWLRNEKGITHKNEEKILSTLQEIIKVYNEILEA